MSSVPEHPVNPRILSARSMTMLKDGKWRLLNMKTRLDMNEGRVTKVEERKRKYSSQAH